MEELNWEYEYEDDEDTEALLEPFVPEAFYKTLKIALQIQAQVAAEEMESAGQLGVSAGQLDVSAGQLGVG